MFLDLFCVVRDPRRRLGQRMFSLISEFILNNGSPSVRSFVTSFAFEACVFVFLVIGRLLGRTWPIPW
jgi:hypothetical protein